MSGLVAAAIVGASVAVISSATSIGMSVDAKNKQAAAQKKAEQAADKALESARETIKQKKLAHLAINLEGEKTAAENQAVVAATGIQTARGGDPRQLAATIGRTQMAQIKEQEALQATRAKRVDDLELLKAKEEQDIQANLAEIDLAEVEGAQIAAGQAAEQQALLDQEIAQSAVALGSSMANLGVAAGTAGVSASNTKTIEGLDSFSQSNSKSTIDMANMTRNSLDAPKQALLNTFVTDNPEATNTQLHSFLVDDLGYTNRAIADLYK
tara:strand:+ start:1310 stop:2116 length:807 start_codon:yes stop_codon:yes gene_type:complete